VYCVAAHPNGDGRGLENCLSEGRGLDENLSAI